MSAKREPDSSNELARAMAAKSGKAKGPMSPYRTRQERDSEGYRGVKSEKPTAEVPDHWSWYAKVECAARAMVACGGGPYWAHTGRVWFDVHLLRFEFLGCGRHESVWFAESELRHCESLDHAVAFIANELRARFGTLVVDVRPFQRLALSWFERVREHRRRTWDFRCPNCGLPAKHLNHVAIKIERDRDEFSSTVTTTFRCVAGEDG